MPFLLDFQRTIMNIISSPPCGTSKHEDSPASAELFGGSTSEEPVGWAGKTHLTTALSKVPASSIEVQKWFVYYVSW